MRKAITFLTVFVMSISLFAQDGAKKHEKYKKIGKIQEPVPSFIHQDYTTNSRSTDVIITCGGGSWESEVSWEILNDAGTVIVSGGAPYSEAASLDDGSYNVIGADAFGDGWNGNYLVVMDASSGEEYLNFTVEGEGGTTTFEIGGAISGCTIADACNYNADATEDDGSCCLTNCLTMNMFDAFGDGWNGGTYTITDALGNEVGSGGLTGGEAGSDPLCLEDGDYTIVVGGGTWDSEITWSITGDGDEIIAQGEAGAFNFTLEAPPAVFFSEYAEGSSSNKYLEIYNGTGGEITIGDFVILGNYNGWPFNEAYPLGSLCEGCTVENGGVFVVVNSDADDAILALADEALDYGDPWYTMGFNGDDVRALAHVSGTDTTILDIIGIVDFDGDGIEGEGSGGEGNGDDDPGSGFIVAGVANGTKDYTLRRKDEVVAGNGGDWAASAGTTPEDSEYIVEARPTAAYLPPTLGWHINQPQDVVTLTFNLDMSGVETSLEGVFVAGGLHLGVAGDNPMSDDDGDDIWTISIEFPANTSTDYTFLNGNCADWSCKENIGGQECAVGQYNDRHIDLGDQDVIVNACFSVCGDGTCDELEPPTTYAANFAIDMNGTGYPNAEYGSVVINGSWNGWSAWGVELSDDDMDGIYTGSLVDALVDGMTVEYIVAVTGEADGWSGWGVVFNAPLDSDCDYVPGDGFGNYGFTVAGADVDLAHIAGSCITCDFNLVSIHMYDAWGDGWNGNALTIFDESLTIEEGDYAFTELCLNDGTYSISCGGGSFQSEVSWEMVNAAGEVLLAGGAPFDGVLQLGETTDIFGCMDEAALNYNGEATMDDGSCYYQGDSCSVAFQLVVGTEGDNDVSADAWYLYTATMDGSVRISSDIAGQEVDTRLAVFSSCDGAGWSGGFEEEPDGPWIAWGDDEGVEFAFASTVEFPITTGTTYIVYWNNLWSSDPFDFTLDESAPPSAPQNLTATAGVGSVFLEWDGIMPATNRSMTSNNRGISIEDAYAKYQAKLILAKGEEPTEVHRFSVVNPDYASNSRSTDVIITCGGGTWESEVSWQILDATETVVAEGGAPSEITASLDDGEYLALCYDAWGDGWNGNFLTVTDAADGTILFDYTIISGDFGAATFIIGDTPPELANLNMSDLHYDVVEDAVMLTIHNTGGSTAHSFFVTYYGSNETSDVCENEDYDDWDQIVYLLPGYTHTYAVLEDASYWMGYGSFDVGVFVDQMCTVTESDETDNTITTTLEITDPYDGVTWNVYRSDVTDFVVVESMDFTDEGLTGDVEYCYYVTQVDTEGAAESDTSNHACATPIAPMDLPVPTDLVAEADGWNVTVNWMAPDLTGFNPMSYTPTSGEKDPGPPYNPADYPNWSSRQGGDTFEDAEEIDGLPYANTGTTMGATADYGPLDSVAVVNLLCATEGWWDGSTGAAADVVYSLTLPEDTDITISLCGSLYDTGLGVFTVSGTDTTLVLANDDFCALESQVSCVLPADTYYIVVSGYGESVGEYIINVTENLPPSPVLGYNVYRGGEPVGSTDNVDSTSFAEFIAIEGDYAYYATAIYEVYGESDPSNSDTVTVGPPAPSCAAPQNLMAETLGNDVSLSWDAPEGGASWFGHNNGTMWTSIGGGDYPAQFSVAARFGQEALADYNGMSLTKVRFVHWEELASYQVAVWTAEPGGSPVLVDTSDWMSGTDIPHSTWIEVELDENITIDWTQELWFGYHVDTPSGWPAMCDDGPPVAGYGDLLAWPTGTEFLSYASLPFNWLLDGFADYAEGRSIASMAPINIEYQNPNTTNEPVEHRLPTPIAINTPSDRNMTNYIVYRDGEAEDTLGLGTTMYLDMDVEWGDHNYFVTALYNDSEECGESEPSNTVDVTLVNHPPPAVGLIQPLDGTTLMVDSENMGNNFPFIWTPVNDADNDPVLYVVSFTDDTGAMHDTVITTPGWLPGPTYGELVEFLLEDSTISVMTYSWNVWAHDPWDSTASLNGPRSLTIDVSGLLALDGIGLPDVFALHNNYPNPFNPVTNISYDIPEVAQVTLEIYNVSGQKVRTLAQGQHEPGRYRIQWNATNDYGNPLSSGMYIYRIQAGDFVSVKKLILMK
jgi:hypothetical protein